MKFTILSLFPSIIKSFFNTSIFAKAYEKNILDYEIINIKDYCQKGKCDDTIYGGGAGLLLKPQPIFSILNSYKNSNSKVILPSPAGKIFNQEEAQSLLEEKNLIFICPRYEGLDQRIIDKFVDFEYSIGDYILSSGDSACMVMIDAIYRLLPGVLHNKNSLLEESYAKNLLEYPQYTKPYDYENMKVPDILLSGNHEKIRLWRKNKSIEKTIKNRPDLYQKYINNLI